MAGSAAPPIWRSSPSPSPSAFATALVPAPWQAYLIVGYAAFVGEAVEGLIVDTDHWRHFFLLLGLIWGLAVATINLRRRVAWERRSAAGDALAASWR